MFSRSFILISIGTVLGWVASNWAEPFGTHPAASQCDATNSGDDEFTSRVAPFLRTYCLRCHGPDVEKAGIAFHELTADMSNADDGELWEQILDMMSGGDMPPEDELSPSDEERAAVAQWIEQSLAEHSETAGVQKAVTRRLTNFEYQNTMRDLLGFELNLIDNLPEDPVKQYHFNNTAELMLMGPEQLDRYLENARQAMASAIVDPGEPHVYRKRFTFEPRFPPLQGLQPDEIGVYGNRRNTAASGMRLDKFPTHGEYRIRIEAASILPPNVSEVPLRLVLGTDLRHDAGTGDYETVGTVHLTNDVDHLQTIEFRGRIENHPMQVGQVTSTGQRPPTLTITAQNLYDNGQLNDHRRGFDTSWNLETPRVVLRSVEFEAPVTDVWPPEHHTRILFDSPLAESDPSAYVRAVLERFMTRAYRRPVTNEELARFVKLYELLTRDFETLEAAMRETLSMVLVSPQFLYHTVADSDAVSKQYELASRLSYFLWGSIPDDELLELAARNELSDRWVLESQVKRLLQDDRSLDFVDNFVSQWLSLEKAKAVKINTDLFPRFLNLYHIGERRGQEISFRPTIRDYMHEETVGFVAELIRRNAKIEQIVDSDFVYVNEPLAMHYGVEGVEGIRLRPVSRETGSRLGGLLTQGSILIGNSTGSAPHPIYRAVWLREAILGEEVRPPPADVPALVDSVGEKAEEATSIKDLLRIHRQKKSCNDCHGRLDPWGIPFEQYSAIGKFQPRVAEEGVRIRGFNREIDVDLAGYQAYLEEVLTVEVDAKATVPGGSEIEGMEELKRYLIHERLDEMEENLVRRLMTYGLGRELTHQDRNDVDRLMQHLSKEEAGIQEVIIAICQSELFVGFIDSEH